MAIAWLCCACSAQEAPALSKQAGGSAPPEVKVKLDNPKVGVVANVAPIFDKPGGKKSIGLLHAGAQLPASKNTFEGEGCKSGFYAVFPRGFLCADHVTTDLSHPTLTAMALRPKLDQPLPYTYARTTKSTPLYKRHPDQPGQVIEYQKLRKNAGLAIVGSWTAKDPDGTEQRLGLTTSGHFVKAVDLRAAEPSNFVGVDLTQDEKLPVGFIVKRGVFAWDIKDADIKKQRALEYHEKISLTGRYRTIGDVRYWATADEHFIRHRDLTVVRRRSILPDFVKPDLKWVDISIITGTAVFYMEKQPIYATLVSVGRDRTGDPKTTDSTEMGTFEVVSKQVTDTSLDPSSLALYYPIYDTPWVIELSSGQHMMGAYWHNRFGIEHTDGSIHFSPADAQRLFVWLEPKRPQGWHGVVKPEKAAASLVLIRK